MKLTTRSMSAFIAGVFLLLITGSCKKETVYPEIQSLAGSAISPTKALLRGKIVSLGDPAILDYGFVYGNSSNLGDRSGIKISLGNAPAEGEYQHQTSVLQLAGMPVLYFRAYMTNAEGTTYGQVLSVAMPNPTFGSISPQFGKSGDLITLQGKFYATSPADVNVSIGNVQAKVTEASDSKIVAEVPSGISAAHGTQPTVQVTIDGQKVVSSYGFVIRAHVKDFLPKSAPIGGTISIIGDNLPSYDSSVRILFGSVQTSTNYSSMSTIVPSALTEEKMKLTVIIQNIATELPGEFTVKAPTITSVSATAAMIGSRIIVEGTDLPFVSGSYDNQATVTLGGVTVYPDAAGANRFAFTVPDLPQGAHELKIRRGPHTITATQKITVSYPTVSGISATSGHAGDLISIKGNFATESGSHEVQFGNWYTVGNLVNNTSLTLSVPSIEQVGEMKVSVRLGNRWVALDEKFTILAPSITSISPASAKPGTLVNISGNGFAGGYYNNYVRFGSSNSPIYEGDRKNLRVQVPFGLQPGTYKVSVINGPPSTNTVEFTVL